MNCTLETLSIHHGHVLALMLAIRGDLVIVGDLMKSITLLQYDKHNQRLNEIARDHENNWMTALEAIGDDMFIGADNYYNLFSVKRIEMCSEEEARRLSNCGVFYLGDLVNRFRKGIK